MAGAHDQLANHLVACLAHRRTDSDRPFRHHIVVDAIPPDLQAGLRALSIAPRAMTGARADNNATRVYFSPPFRAANPAADRLARAFQDKRVVGAAIAACGALLRSSYLLIELACDSGPCELRPHRDLGVKRFTALFYLNDDPVLKNAGTDLYTPKTQRIPDIRDAVARGVDPARDCFEETTVRPPHGARFGYFFTPSDVSWHGFDRRSLDAVRKTIIVNYVGPTPSGETYRSVQNLAFPDEPVLS